MGRPPKCRRVEFMPHCTYFKPAGIPLRDLEEVGLSVEEVEALRLKDIEGLEQEECADRMGISRPTFQRILVGARAKVAEALVRGKAIRVEGGNFQLITQWFRCARCNNEWGRPRGNPDEDEQCPACGGKEIKDVSAARIQDLFKRGRWRRRCEPK
ncbi:MAG: DUF134 domain-containing protein [Bacillota bacterium]